MGVMLSLDRTGPARGHRHARHARRPGGQARVQALNPFRTPPRSGYVDGRGEAETGSLVAMPRDQASSRGRLLSKLTRTVLARRNRSHRDATAPPATPTAGSAAGPAAGRAPVA
jgi:hypothetical protein